MNMSEKFSRQAEEFRGLARLFASLETFKDMQMATVCIGLAEVAERLALDSRFRSRRNTTSPDKAS